MDHDNFYACPIHFIVCTLITRFTNKYIDIFSCIYFQIFLTHMLNETQLIFSAYFTEENSFKNS